MSEELKDEAIKNLLEVIKMDKQIIEYVIGKLVDPTNQLNEEFKNVLIYDYYKTVKKEVFENGKDNRKVSNI